jgi:hypothetical protein
MYFATVKGLNWKQKRCGGTLMGATNIYSRKSAFLFLGSLTKISIQMVIQQVDDQVTTAISDGDGVTVTVNGYIVLGDGGGHSERLCGNGAMGTATIGG